MKFKHVEGSGAIDVTDDNAQLLFVIRIPTNPNIEPKIATRQRDIFAKGLAIWLGTIQTQDFFEQWPLLSDYLLH